MTSSSYLRNSMRSRIVWACRIRRSCWRPDRNLLALDLLSAAVDFSIVGIAFFAASCTSLGHTAVAPDTTQSDSMRSRDEAFSLVAVDRRSPSAFRAAPNVSHFPMATEVPAFAMDAAPGNFVVAVFAMDASTSSSLSLVAVFAMDASTSSSLSLQLPDVVVVVVVVVASSTSWAKGFRMVNGASRPLFAAGGLAGVPGLALNGASFIFQPAAVMEPAVAGAVDGAAADKLFAAPGGNAALAAADLRLASCWARHASVAGEGGSGQSRAR
jgi:hypothetical protein